MSSLKTCHSLISLAIQLYSFMYNIMGLRLAVPNPKHLRLIFVESGAMNWIVWLGLESVDVLRTFRRTTYVDTCQLKGVCWMAINRQCATRILLTALSGIQTRGRCGETTSHAGTPWHPIPELLHPKSCQTARNSNRCTETREGLWPDKTSWYWRRNLLPEFVPFVLELGKKNGCMFSWQSFRSMALSKNKTQRRRNTLRV